MGGPGDIYRGRLFDGFRVAIRTMRVLNDPSDSSGIPEPLTVFTILLCSVRVKSQTILQDISEDLHTWSNCRHLNVLPLLGLVDFRSQIGMVTCWMENGSVPTYLYRHPEVDRCQMVRFPILMLCKKYTKIYLHLVHWDM